MNIDKKLERKIQISVIGDADASEENLKLAYDLGRLIAKKGIVLICGGRTGIMEAVCKGAFDEDPNSIRVGILPSSSKDEANQYCNVIIPTGIGAARNFINVLAGDGVIAIGGRAGTLSELAFAWIYNKPIVVLERSGGWSSILANKRIDDRRNDVIHGAETPEEALNKILSLIMHKSI